MSDTVSIKIKVEDDNTLRTVTVSASEVAAALNRVQDEVTGLKAEFVNLASLSQIMEGVGSAVGQLHGMFSSLTDAYNIQAAAEVRLAQAMRNTMGATDEEIQSVKDLCSAQQQVGIVGDEVQLSAAQELATYLEYSDSLRTLIPVMNDMVAQQLSLGASGESAAQIASMLGKVMNGQTEALSRYGYKFDEAQKYILKFGEESERAAVLAQVISDAVGGMNEAMGGTDVGRMQAVSNTLGDIREMLGQVVQGAMPVVSVLAEITMASSGVMRLVSAFRALNLETLRVKAGAVAAAYAQRTQAAAARLLGVSEQQAAVATGALRVQIVALQAVMTMGLAAAVSGVVAAIARLSSRTLESADALDDARDAEEAFSSASVDMRLRLAEETVKLEDLIRKKKSTAEAVRGLNAEYGNIFGSHATAKEWYEVLTKRSADYCKQLGYEAEAKVKAAKSGRLQVRRDELVDKMEAMQRAAGGGLKEKEEFYTPGANMTQIRHERITEYGRLAEEVRKLDTEIIIADTDYRKCMESAQALSDSLKGQVTVDEEAAKQLEKLADDIIEYRKAVENASAANSVFGTSVSDTEARLSAMRSGLTSLIGKYGTESDSVRQLVTEYRELLKVRDAANGTLLKPVTVPLEYTVKKMKDGRMQDVTETAYASVQNTPKLTRPKGQKSQRRQAAELYDKLQGMLPDASDLEVDSIRAAMKKLEDLYAGIGRKGEKGMGGAADAVHALSAAMGGLSGVVDDAAASWLSWGANLLQVIGQALPALSSLFAANTSVAGSGAAASVASIPYVGPILAVAAVASIVAAMASLPKFAKGGLAYGPTLGLFGEYPGASGNPEVVAPLSDLTGILAGAGIGGGKAEFVIKGRRLVAINDKMNRYYGRNGQ